MESKLMPCPFCGENIVIARVGGGWIWRHVDGYNTGCPIMWSHKYKTAEEAKNAWNRRTRR